MGSLNQRLLRLSKEGFFISENRPNRHFLCIISVYSKNNPFGNKRSYDKAGTLTAEIFPTDRIGKRKSHFQIKMISRKSKGGLPDVPKK